jgi:hypothetical protein
MHRDDHSIGGRECVFIAGMESEAIRSDVNSSKARLLRFTFQGCRRQT